LRREGAHTHCRCRRRRRHRRRRPPSGLTSPPPPSSPHTHTRERLRAMWCRRRRRLPPLSRSLEWATDSKGKEDNEVLAQVEHLQGDGQHRSEGEMRERTRMLHFALPHQIRTKVYLPRGGKSVDGSVAATVFDSIRTASGGGTWRRRCRLASPRRRGVRARRQRREGREREREEY